MKTAALVDYVRREYEIIIGDATAEKILSELDSGGAEKIDVVGRHARAGVPRAFTLTSNEVRQALKQGGFA